MSGSPTEMPEGSPGHLPAHSATGPLDRDPAVRELFGHPTAIGRYHILEVIGEGGMGVVYRAEQRHPVRRTVALKLIKPGMDSRQIIARFESERQALALMDHPNVARVLDAGASDAGRPYFVMEYVPGESITQFCDRHAHTTRQRLELFIQACDAVQHAHQKAIIHRDLKPSNILVMLQDGKPRVKVIDFGVAKATAQKLTDRTLVTETGQMLGTREYMSPEQAEMSGLDVDTRSDVYSLGVVLYELLTGALPFDDLRSGGQKEMQRIIREVDPPRPSTRLSGLGASAETIARRRNTQLLELEKELKTELEWIPLKAMRKDRADRYATPAQLAEDVQNYLHHRPLLAAPESAGYRLRKFVRRNKGPVSAAAAILLVLIAGIAGTTIGLIGQARQRGIAEVQKTRAQEQAQRADREAAAARNEAAKQQAIGDFLAQMLGAADPDRLLGDKVTVLQATQEAIKRLDAGMLKDQPLIEASVRNTMASVLRDIGRLDEAERVLRKAVELDRAFAPPDNSDIGQSLDNLAQVLQAQGKLPEAESTYRQAVDAYRRKFPAGHPYIATTLENLALCVRASGKFDESEKLLREALSIREKGPIDEQLAFGLNNLGWLLQEQGRLDDADPLLLRALEVRRKFLPPGHPEIAQTLNSLGWLRQQQGRLEESEAFLREGLEMYRKAMPEGHVNIASNLNSLALTLHLRGQLDEAEPLFVEALSSYRKALPPGHLSIAAGANNFGMLLKDTKRHAESEALLREALEIHRNGLPAGHPNIATSLKNLAILFIEQNRFAQAEPFQREALDILRQSRGPRAAPTTQAAAALASTLDQLSRPADAQAIRREYALIPSLTSGPATRSAP